MKIDLDWIQKELDAGREVKLECVNVERFEECNHANHDILKQGKLRVKGVDCIFGTVYLQGDGLGESDNCIIKREFEFFRIKRPTPTFDDLIEVVRKAFEDKIVSEYREYRINDVPGIDFAIDGERLDSWELDSDYEARINLILSTYTETFVIESEEDIDRVNADAVIVLSNGSELTEIVTKRKDSIEFSSLGVLYFYMLKGATVTQNKERKEII